MAPFLLIFGFAMVWYWHRLYVIVRYRMLMADQEHPHVAGPGICPYCERQPGEPHATECHTQWM